MENKLYGIYAIVDYTCCKGYDIIAIIERLLSAGIKLIQYRDKERNTALIEETAKKILNLTKKNDALLIINDFPEIAYHIGADGYHLGQQDKNKKIKNGNLISGRSVGSLNEALDAQKDNVDYLGVGTVFPTKTKDNVNIIGINRLRQIVEGTYLPVFAIGGINKKNLYRVIESGASGAAIVSAFYINSAIKQNAMELINIFKKSKLFL